MAGKTPVHGRDLQSLSIVEILLAHQPHEATYQYADAREFIRRGLEIRPGDKKLLALRRKATIKRAPEQLVDDIKGLFD